MAPAAVLLLFGLLSSAVSLPPPRMSFLLDSADRRLVLFNLPDVHNTTTLLLSNDGSTLYVGARDAVLSLDVSQGDVISLKKKVMWSPTDEELRDCGHKGKNSTVDCPNFVRVLQLINSTHLYACGSYAYSPRDVYIDAESFTMGGHGDAKGRCPYNPFQRNTAITAETELFTATTADFRGVKPQISRHFSKDGRPDVSQDSSVSLLEEPTFVSSALDPSDRKLYFFFSEVGREFSFINELQIARVAQVCKDDVGGQRTLQKKWTSFAKAPLLCQSSKQLPFNILQDMFTIQPSESSDTDTLFYGVFTSQWSSSPESAVCVFKLQDMKAVFTDSYRTFDMETHQWSPMLGKHSYLGQCDLGSATDSVLAEVKKSFLTSDSVKPVGGSPVVVSSQHQYSRVAAMRTQAANGKQYTVLFLLTESGFLHKMVLLDRGVHVIEEIQVFTQPQLVKNIVLSSSKGLLYVGTSEGVSAVPVAKCSIYRTCSQCVLARDPLCGWSRTRKVCSSLHGGQDDMAQDLENLNVEQECQRQIKASPATELYVHLDQAVKLQCLKPSNLATLRWTHKNQRQKLFIQSDDGSLNFLATANTFGIYQCEAEEGGFREVIASYNVRPSALPRSTSTFLTVAHVPNDEKTTYKDVATDELEMSTRQPSGEPEVSTKAGREDKFTTTSDDETLPNKEDHEQKIICRDGGLNTLTPEKESQSLECTQMVTEVKSYYSELVVVSSLLAVCVCVLIIAALHIRRQKMNGLKVNPLISPEDSSKTVQSIQSMESVPSLSSPEDPEVKVVE